jgi:hypothetical protein
MSTNGLATFQQFERQHSHQHRADEYNRFKPARSERHQRRTWAEAG